MSQQAFWDAATRKVVLDRVRKIPPIRFFTSDEAELFRAVCDRIIPQDDRDSDHQIVIVNFIDERLHENRLDGYRFENMPPDQEAYQLGLRAIAEIAQHLYAKSFLGLTALEQEFVLKTVHDGNPAAGHDIWKRMPVHRFWHLLVQDIVGIYYAHPYAWNEIGLGGLHIRAATCGWKMEILNRGKSRRRGMSGKLLRDRRPRIMGQLLECRSTRALRDNEAHIESAAVWGFQRAGPEAHARSDAEHRRAHAKVQEPRGSGLLHCGCWFSRRNLTSEAGSRGIQRGGI